MRVTMRRLVMRDPRGFTLVELLVVLTILGVIGAIVSLSITRGLEGDAQARDRIEAFEDMQIAIERMSRDIRAADPLLTAEPNRIETQVRRDGDCFRITYRLVGQDLMTSQQLSTDDCDNFGAGPEQILMQNIDLAANPDLDAVFDYFTDEREAPVDDEGDFDGDKVAIVEINLVRTLVLDQRPVTVRTVVGLRNR